MTLYKESDFAEIANAIGMDVARVAKHGSQFEAAAYWYRQDERRPRRIAPSKLREKLDRVANSAHRLLESLGVNQADEAADGPCDPEILNALVLSGEPNEDPVIDATRRIGRLVEVIDGVTAAAEFDRRARKAAIIVTEVSKLTVREGNPGDDAVNDWIAAMMGLYRMITGKEPGTSVGAPDRSNKGRMPGAVGCARSGRALPGKTENDLAISNIFRRLAIFGSLCANPVQHPLRAADLRRPMR